LQDQKGENYGSRLKSQLFKESQREKSVKEGYIHLGLLKKNNLAKFPNFLISLININTSPNEGTIAAVEIKYESRVPSNQWDFIISLKLIQIFYNTKFI